MALSDHDKRVLDQMEQLLRIDDPDLTAFGSQANCHIRTDALASLTLLVAGFGLSIVGLQLSGPWVAIVGVLGFAALVAGIDCGLRATRRLVRERKGRSHEAPRKR